MLKTAKQNVLKLAKRGGAFSLLAASRFRRDRLLILAYHGISLDDEHLWNSSLFVPEDFLRRRFELIRKHKCNVLPFAEALERLYSRSLPERAVAITFDDGCHNFCEKALPLLKEFQFPATVYLTTYYAQFNKPVFPVAADYLLWKAGPKIWNLKTVIGLDERIDNTNELQRKRAHSLIVAHADDNGLTADEKDRLLSLLCDALGVSYIEFCEKRIMRLMDENEVARITAEGIDVQLHTHRHRVPSDRDLFLREIEDNSEAIRSMTARDARHLCYPSGEYDSKFFPWMEEANVLSATTCETALSTPSTHRYLLPRLVDTMPLSDIEFEGWLTGISHFLPQRKR